MFVKAKVTSKTSNKTIEKLYTPHELLEYFYDECSLVSDMTMCNCQPVGETNSIDCRCEYEWDDYDLIFEENK